MHQHHCDSFRPVRRLFKSADEFAGVPSTIHDINSHRRAAYVPHHNQCSALGPKKLTNVRNSAFGDKFADNTNTTAGKSTT